MPHNETDGVYRCMSSQGHRLPSIGLWLSWLLASHFPQLGAMPNRLLFSYKGVSAICGCIWQMFASLLVVGNRLLIGLVLSCSVILGCYYRYPDYTPFALPLLLITQAPISLHVIVCVFEHIHNDALI